jgi:hypothetical protein
MFASSLGWQVELRLSRPSFHRHPRRNRLHQPAVALQRGGGVTTRWRRLLHRPRQAVIDFGPPGARDERRRARHCGRRGGVLRLEVSDEDGRKFVVLLIAISGSNPSCSAMSSGSARGKRTFSLQWIKGTRLRGVRYRSNTQAFDGNPVNPFKECETRRLAQIIG